MHFLYSQLSNILFAVMFIFWNSLCLERFSGFQDSVSAPRGAIINNKEPPNNDARLFNTLAILLECHFCHIIIIHMLVSLILIYGVKRKGYENPLSD
jgi:hypothetical protein